MNLKEDLKFKVLIAARDQGINSMLFRNTLAKKFGLNLTESLCLTILGINGSSTPTQLARYTGLTTGSTTTMLDRLAKKNIIRRKANQKDRRGVIIEITEEYSQAAQKLVSGIQKAHQELISRYTDEELKVVADFLTRLTDNMIEHSKRIENNT